MVERWRARALRAQLATVFRLWRSEKKRSGADRAGVERTHLQLASAREVQVNSRTHVPQMLTGLISLCTNPVSMLRVSIQTVP